MKIVETTIHTGQVAEIGHGIEGGQGIEMVEGTVPRTGLQIGGGGGVETETIEIGETIPVSEIEGAGTILLTPDARADVTIVRTEGITKRLV
jgi:hypothetical protein